MIALGPFRSHLKIPKLFMCVEWKITIIIQCICFLLFIKLDSKVPVIFINNNSELYESLEN